LRRHAISAVSRLYLGRISAASRPHLGRISAASRLYLGRISAVSRPHLGRISAVSRLYLGRISQPHVDRLYKTFDVAGQRVIDQTRDDVPGIAARFAARPHVLNRAETNATVIDETWTPPQARKLSLLL